MKLILSVLLPALCAALLGSPGKADDVEWAQIQVVMIYQRSGTLATAPEGRFSYVFSATLDEVMARVPAKGARRPDYVLLDEYAESFALHGTHSLVAEISQFDQPTGKTYTASAKLTGALSKADEFRLERVTANPLLGEGYGADLKVAAPLKGSFTSTYPRMPDVAPEESVLLFPSPVKFDKEVGFISEGPVTVFPVLVSRPTDPNVAMVYDMAVAAQDLPTLGGFSPPSIGAVTTGPADHWVLTLKKEKKFDTLTGGNYTDTISLEIKVVPLSLPRPKKRTM